MNKRIDLEELVKLSSVYLITPNYKGDKIAYYSDKTGRIELYVMDLDSREIKQVTHGEAPRALSAGFVWTRDDKAIVFAKDKDGDEQHNLFLIQVESGDIQQLNNDPTQEYAVEVHPDNVHLTVISTKNGQANIHLLNMRTLEWIELTQYRRPAMAGSWSPDGNWLSFGTNEDEDMRNMDGYLISRDGQTVRKVLDTGSASQDDLGDWHPDGRHIAVTSDAFGDPRAGILDIDSNEVRWLSPEGVAVTAGRFSPDGLWLSAIRNYESSLSPVLYNTETGEERVLSLPAGLAMGTSFVLGGKKLILSHNSSASRTQVLLYDLAFDTYEVLIPADYGALDPSVFVEAEHLYYTSSDGKRVPAILYKPRDIPEGAKLPAVVEAHGGPTGQWFMTFNPFTQFLVDSGYVVLQPNVRGSTGYGVKWRDMNLKDWGGGDLEDLAAGAEYLKSLDYVEGDRLAVYGGSYGGYMSFISVVKKPDLFKVGLPIVGITDLFKLYEEDMPHFQYYLEQQLGHPDDNKELYRDRSAVTHAEKLTAKLLIVHGLNDPRCPISQARGFRDRLLELGKREGTDADADFEYHEFEDEGHGPGGDVEQRLRNLHLIADFLERRL